MKKLLGILVIAGLAACNNDTGMHHHDNASAPKNAGDSLYKEVMEGHDVGMNKRGQLEQIKNKAQAALDSISKLPEKAQQEAAPLKAKLESLKQEASDAWAGMEKWMEEFKINQTDDTAKNRIEYLTTEKLKIDKVKEAILNSLNKADSLFKK